MFSTMFRHEFALLFYYFFCSLCAVFVFISIQHRINHPPWGSQDCVFCVSFLSLIFTEETMSMNGMTLFWMDRMMELVHDSTLHLPPPFNDKIQKYIQAHFLSSTDCGQILSKILCVMFLLFTQDQRAKLWNKKIVEQYWTNFVLFFICFLPFFSLFLNIWYYGLGGIK